MSKQKSNSKTGCSICESNSNQSTIEFGYLRGESGAIGFDICEKCRRAAEWHEENTEKSRCVNCAKKGSKSMVLSQPNQRDTSEIWTAEIHLCRECYAKSGGLEDCAMSDVAFRARSNIDSDWDTQRRLALDRDSYCCQDCGYSGGRLHVHHKICQDDGGTDNLNNLITLCPECHSERHNAQPCRICGSVVYDDKGHATWTDDGGGSYEIFCEECMHYIKQSGADGSRCSICARLKDSDAKSDGITFFDDYSDSGKHDGAPEYPTCDECRDKIVFSSRQKTEAYLDRELPDEYVNVRHWER